MNIPQGLTERFSNLISLFPLYLLSICNNLKLLGLSLMFPNYCLHCCQVSVNNVQCERDSQRIWVILQDLGHISYPSKGWKMLFSWWEKVHAHLYLDHTKSHRISKKLKFDSSGYQIRKKKKKVGFPLLLTYKVPQ